MIRPILCGLAQAVYEIILIKVICAVPSGAARFKRMIVHRGARIRLQVGPFTSRLPIGWRHENAVKTEPNVGMKTCEITDNG